MHAMANDTGTPEEVRQAIVDAEHLKLLAVGYCISAGMCALFSLLGLVYMTIGLVILLVLTPGFLKLRAGRCLAKRRSRVFCMVIAGFSCLGVPYGTLLGVFTFIVLGQPSVRALFESARQGTAAGAFDWLGKLTANRRAVFVASGIGTQLFPARFRGHGGEPE